MASATASMRDKENSMRRPTRPPVRRGRHVGVGPLQLTLARLLALGALGGLPPARVAHAATTITDCSDHNAIEARLEGGRSRSFRPGGQIAVGCG